MNLKKIKDSLEGKMLNGIWEEGNTLSIEYSNQEGSYTLRVAKENGKYRVLEFSGYHVIDTPFEFAISPKKGDLLSQEEWDSLATIAKDNIFDSAEDWWNSLDEDEEEDWVDDYKELDDDELKREIERSFEFFRGI